ncbi:MAG TPA: tetratricopeptide repeat protein [Polyangia bacterium]|nr:tetratricopeptide repeat protein [Polyangia bacterium]
MRAAVALALVVAACSGAPLPADFAHAQSLESTDPERARALYDALDARCKTVKLAHDDCALVAVRLAELDESAGRWADAEGAWQRAAAITAQPRTAARALERAADVAHGELHDDAAAGALAWRVVESYPDEIPADDALKIAIRIDEARDWAALAARLATLYPRVVKFDIGDNVLFERGMLLARHDQGSEAVAIFDALADAYPHSSLRDDGLWRAAELLRQSGDFEGALRRLRRILSTRKDAIITGSYNYLQLDDAQLLVGRIYLDDLHDPARAAEAFELLADDYPESTLRDDALYELARAKREAKDVPAACRALARLVKQFPDGNRVRAARTLEQELGCT